MELRVVVGAAGSFGSGVSRNEFCRRDDRAGVSGRRVSRSASRMMELLVF